MTPADVEVQGLARFFGSSARQVVALEPTTFAIAAQERIAAFTAKKRPGPR